MLITVAVLGLSWSLNTHLAPRNLFRFSCLGCIVVYGWNTFSDIVAH